MSTPTVAVLGFYADPGEQAALRATFERFAYPNKQLVLHVAEREGELQPISAELGEAAIACIHPSYDYPASYLDDLAWGLPTKLDAVWTADRTARPGLLGDSNPDLYQSLLPAHVVALLFTRHGRQIAAEHRNAWARAIRLLTCDTRPVQTNGALPYGLTRLNGLYWMVDYAYRMDRRCIEAYLDVKKIGRDGLALDGEAFVASLSSLEQRHLKFFLSSNIAGKRAVEYLEKHIDLSTVKTALDIGSGYGGLVKALIDRGCATTGLEIMSNLTDLARINLEHHDAAFIVGDFLKVDLPDDHYDLITMTDVIEHVASAEAAMARIAKALRPGGYTYMKVPNYRFIDHVREDAHTGLFGITLLRHDPAAAYLDAVNQAKYTVGEYYDYDWYLDTFAKYGVALVQSDNVKSPIEDLPKLRDGCDAAFGRWESTMQLAPDMKDNIRRHVGDYLRDFDRLGKPRRRWEWPFPMEHDELFLRDYLTAHWNMFFRKA